MKKYFAALFLAFGFVHCTQSPGPSGPVTLRGYYVSGDEVNVFRNCADNKHYRVKDATGKLDSLYREACFPAPVPYEATYAVLTGTIGAKSSVGGASGDDDMFTVNRVDTLQSKTMFNACMPYEFWCHGTEPFWGLQISKAEGGIFLKNMADETGSRYAWAEPRSDGATSWVYETTGSGRSLKVVIKKTKCSDGMSDIEYGYSAEVIIGGETLRGCAIRGGEPIPRPPY